LINKQSVTFGRRRFIGYLMPDDEIELDRLNLHSFLGLKKFVKDKTTNRFLNDFFFLFCLDGKWVLAKEVSSLPPISGSVDFQEYFFFDVDFPSGELEEKTYKIKSFKELDFDTKLWRFDQDSIFQFKSCDNITLTSIFFKNGIDFLRSTMLKEHLDINR